MTTTHIPVYTISLPNYTQHVEPDYLAVGSQLDALIEAHCLDHKIAIRGITADDHPGLSLDDLVATILHYGTDRYDPQRRGVLHDFYAPYQIDLHAMPCYVSETEGLISSHCNGPSVMAELVGDFYTGPPIDRGGVPIRLDVLMVYDYARLAPIYVCYGDKTESDPCAFRFKNPTQKPKALLELIKIL